MQCNMYFVSRVLNIWVEPKIVSITLTKVAFGGSKGWHENVQCVIYNTVKVYKAFISQFVAVACHAWTIANSLTYRDLHYAHSFASI